MKKIEKIGWVGKTWPFVDIENYYGELKTVGVYAEKKTRKQWWQGEWPPVNVKITIEEVK